jgi:hypothetical protein
MSGVTLNVETPDLASFQEDLAQFGVIAQQQVLQAAGSGVRISLIEHFTKIEQDDVHHLTATRLGAGRSHFYGGVAKGVQFPVSEGAGEVSVSINNVGIAQRYFGGPITPKDKQWLTIPAVAEAYGRPANSFNNLNFVLFRPDLAALIEKTPGQPSLAKRTRKAKNGVIKQIDATNDDKKPRVIYWLKKEVQQAPDPTVLPTDDEMSEAAVEAGREALSRIQPAKDTNG